MITATRPEKSTGSPSTSIVVASLSQRKSVYSNVSNRQCGNNILDMSAAQGFTSTYAPRLRQYGNSFLTPVLQTQAIPPAPRTTKRGTAIKNYADDDDDFDFASESESQRRPVGIRNVRQVELEKRETQHDKLGREITEPVNLLGIYREWMIRRTVKPT